MDNPKVSRSRLFEGGEGGMCRWRKTQVLGTRFRPGFVYNMGDEEASKDAGRHTVGRRRPKALLVTMDSSLACRTLMTYPCDCSKISFANGKSPQCFAKRLLQKKVMVEITDPI